MPDWGADNKSKRGLTSDGRAYNLIRRATAKPHGSNIMSAANRTKGDRSTRDSGSRGGRLGGSGRGAKSGASSGRHVGAPASGRISSNYGSRKDPKTGKTATHKGIDIAVKANTPVWSTGAGVVVRSGWQDPKNHKAGFGERVTINHGSGNTSTYGHLNSINVKVGDKVARGQVIGKSGNTGKSTGPHLHYEERRNGTPHGPTFDPKNYKPHR